MIQQAIPQTFADRDCIHPEPPRPFRFRGPSVFHASAWTAWMSFAQSSASQWIPPFQWAAFWTCAKRISMNWYDVPWAIQKDGDLSVEKPMLCLGKWSRNHGSPGSESPVPLPQIDGVGSVAAPVSSLETSTKTISVTFSKRDLSGKNRFLWTCETREDSSGRPIVKGS